MRTRSVIVVGLVLAACSGGGPALSGSVPAPSPETTVTTGPSETSSTTVVGTSEATTTTVAAGRPEPDPSRQLAPDFTLVLGDGSTYTYANEIRPVYLVFWAEW